MSAGMYCHSAAGFFPEVMALYLPPDHTIPPATEQSLRLQPNRQKAPRDLFPPRGLSPSGPPVATVPGLLGSIVLNRPGPQVSAPGVAALDFDRMATPVRGL